VAINGWLFVLLAGSWGRVSAPVLVGTHHEGFKPKIRDDRSMQERNSKPTTCMKWVWVHEMFSSAVAGRSKQASKPAKVL